MTGEQIFDELVAELKGISTELYSPPVMEKSDDKVLCTIDDPFLRRLFGYAAHLRRTIDELTIEFKYNPRDKQLATQRDLLQLKTEALGNLLWYITRERYSLKENYVGLRNNWTVVVVEPDDDDDEEDMLRKIFKQFP